MFFIYFFFLLKFKTRVFLCVYLPIRQRLADKFSYAFELIFTFLVTSMNNFCFLEKQYKICKQNDTICKPTRHRILDNTASKRVPTLRYTIFSASSVNIESKYAISRLGRFRIYLHTKKVDRNALYTLLITNINKPSKY